MSALIGRVVAVVVDKVDVWLPRWVSLLSSVARPRLRGWWWQSLSVDSRKRGRRRPRLPKTVTSSCSGHPAAVPRGVTSWLPTCRRVETARLIQHALKAPIRAGLLLLRVSPFSLTSVLLRAAESRSLTASCSLRVLLDCCDLMGTISVVRPIFFSLRSEVLAIWTPGRSGPFIDLLFRHWLMCGRLGWITESIAVSHPNCISKGFWHVPLQQIGRAHV